ncbi:MAG: DUF1549 domain-containing protein [Verrucomicrobiales bacterium]|nr:DUF1549 domain-containing protein [Verrucomicrobiales bacterium]
MKIFATTAFIAAVFLSSGFAAEKFDKKAAIKKIDQLVEQGLKKHDMKRGAEINDSTFVRRAYLDIAGRIPTIEESENFLGSTYERKREQLIADLLESDGHVSHTFNFWADVLRINAAFGNGSPQAEAAYQLWIKEAVEQNRPYNEVVYDMVSATGKIWDNGAVGYYLRDRGMPLDNMSNTVRVFLGTRLECAQCHNHPFDKWTQMDYYKMAAFSYGMDTRGYSSENRDAYNVSMRDDRMEKHRNMLEKAGYKESKFPVISNQRGLERYTKSKKYQGYLDRLKMTDKEFRKLAKKSMAVYDDFQEESKSAQFALGRIYQSLRYYSTVEKEKALKLPHDYQYSDAKPHEVVEAGTMFGAEIDLENIDETSIDAYAKWMTSPENPTFTKVIANRLWKRVFGHGVFEPVDELTDHTYVANPELLDYITNMMKELNYDMRAYMDVLFNTRTYQSAAWNGEMVMGAPYHFPGPVFRRMTAEQIWDSIVALALPEADSYRPHIKSQLSTVEKYRQMYIALEERPPADYIAMIDDLANAIKDNRPKQEQIRKDMYIAREAKDDAKYRELRAELNVLTREERNAIQEIAFNHVGKKVDPDALLAAVGMSEMTMSAGAMTSDGMPKLENAVLTELPKIKMAEYKAPKPPEGLDAVQMKKWKKDQAYLYKKWKSAQANELRNYKNLVAQMARASELESPARRGHFLREFGQSDREVIENAAYHASVPQALNLLNGTIVEALTNQYAVFGSRIHSAGDAEEKIKMIFQAMLTREPTQREIELVKAEIEAKGEQAYESVVWALLNTQQFIFVQ